MSSSIRHRRLIATAIVLGAVLILVVLFATRPRQQRRKPPVPVPMVTVHRVTGGHDAVEITGWGTVQPQRTIDLVPQVAGRVTAVSPHLLAGAFFAAGEVLLEIETVDYELAVEQALSQVAQAEYGVATAQEEARLARDEWQHTQADALEGSALAGAEPNPLVYREPQLRQAEAQLAAARAALAQAELSLSRCRLTAPFAGRVERESVDLGQYVSPGQVLGTIYDTGIAEITVELPDRELAWIRVPQTPTDRFDGSPATVHAEFAGRSHTWSGRAARVAGAVDAASRQVPIVVEVTAPYAVEDGRPPLLSGMFVGVTFAGPAPDGAVTVPRRGLRPGDQVWVLDADDRLHIRQATVARAGIEEAVITAGLAPGDRLVVSNLQYVVEGMQLRTADVGAGSTATARGGDAQ